MEFFLNEMEHSNKSQNPQIMSHDDLVMYIELNKTYYYSQEWI